jgi:glycosyltransferase involved in cell wall biosynthesis
MKKIGYLVSQYPAPSHTFIRREVEALRRRGLPIETFSVRAPAASERLGQPDRDERARTFYILPGKRGAMLSAHVWALSQPGRYLSTLVLALRHRVPGVKQLIWSLFYFAEAIVLARELSRRGIGHLHNHFANAGGTVGMLACHFVRIGWSLTLHGTSEHDYPAGLLLGSKLRRARFAACVSSFGMAQAMRAADPRDWEKLFIVRCGVDTRALPPPPTPDAAPPRLVCVGRLAPEKGHLGLIEAFHQVVRRGQAAELRLVGDGPERARIEAAIAARGLEGRCLLLGQRPEEETLAEVARAQLLVSASFMEGLPVSLMEALALGVPVIAPRVAGIPELIEDGVSGLLFTPADWSALAACLERALGDPALRQRLGRAGRERVRADFDADTTCEPLHRKLAEALSLVAPTPAAAPVAVTSGGDRADRAERVDRLPPPLPGPPGRGSG